MAVTVTGPGTPIVVSNSGGSIQVGASISLTGDIVQGGGSGSIAIRDIAVPGGAVSSKVWQDSPGNTVLQSCTVSGLTLDVTVRSTYPLVTVGGQDFTLPQSGDVYEDTVQVAIPGSVELTAVAKTGDDQPGASDSCQVTVSFPPTVTAAIFTGGYPGSQTELKENDTFQLQVTADKNFDQVVISDFDACKSATIGVVTGTSATVTVTIDDEGDVATLRAARVQVRDAVTAALSATYDTDSAGSVDGVNVVNCNNLFPTANWSSPTYPGIQQALKNTEQATLALTVADQDSVVVDSPNGQLTIIDGVPPGITVERLTGDYNISTNNLRATATRNANDAETVSQTVVNIAHVAASVGVTEATARVRSGPAPGADTEITITSDQSLLSAPSLDPAASRGTFQGSWVGGPAVWTRDLRVPDSENPADGSSNTWINLSATNLAGIVTNTITGDATYVVGGFTQRTLNFAAFTADSTETFPLTTEGNLSVGVFSNGNTGVIQPFGTADTSDVGKEGWCAPTAASGVAVQMHMLHIPTVNANSGGITLTLVEETA